MREKIKKYFKVKSSKRGFTMIELLAVVAIIALVVSIGGYSVISIINNSNEKQYKLSIANVENAAEGYFLEQSTGWIENAEEGYYYQCVSVQKLIDMGFFKTDLLGTNVSKDRKIKADDKVLVLRDSYSKSIISSEFLFDDSEGVCEDLPEESAPVASVEGNIVFAANPNADGKNIEISYNLINVSDDALSDYIYSYEIVGKETINNTFDEFEEKYDFLIYETSKIYATIKKGNNVIAENVDTFVVESTGVEDADNVGPRLEILPHLEYLSAGANSKEISIRAYDNESGLKVKTHTINYLFTTEKINSCDALIANSSSSSVSLNVSAGNEFGNHDETITVPDIKLSTPGNLNLYVCSKNLEDNGGNVFDGIVKNELKVYDLENTISTALFYLPSLLVPDGDGYSLGSGSSFFADLVSLPANTKFYYLWSQPINLFKYSGLMDCPFVGAYVAFDDISSVINDPNNKYYKEALNSAEVIIDDGTGTKYVFGYIPLENSIGMGGMTCLTTIPCK